MNNSMMMTFNKVAFTLQPKKITYYAQWIVKVILAILFISFYQLSDSYALSTTHNQTRINLQTTPQTFTHANCNS